MKGVIIGSALPRSHGTHFQREGEPFPHSAWEKPETFRKAFVRGVILMVVAMAAIFGGSLLALIWVQS